MAVNFLSQANVQSILNQYATIPTNPCPDQLYGQYSNGILIPFIRDDINYDVNNKIASYTKRGMITNRIIAVVLESPHKHEYNGANPIGPAQNSTGRLFQKEFHNLFSQSLMHRNINPKGIYDVILLNSVQFQCSLGISLRTHKSKMDKDNRWLNIFFNCGGNQDIIDRINALNPLVVINLCTVGYYNLQMNLDRQIKSSNVTSNYTCGTHPSTWNFSFAKIF